MVLPEHVDSVITLLTGNESLTYLEETQGFDLIQFVKCEAVVDASRNDKKIAWLDVNTDPLVRGVFCVLEISG